MSCMTELVEIFVNCLCIVRLSRSHYIEMSHFVGKMKCQESECNFAGLKSVKSITDNNMSEGGFVG